MTMDKTFSPTGIEERIHEDWMQTNAFAAGAGSKAGADSFSIVIPPPNVTGSLHMGHALNNTLQDVLVRWKRMQGFDVLWQPGTDHAGIATQMVVERQLSDAGGPTRAQLGREEFVKRVWQWKEESGGTITTQLKRLGASCDWSRERFTMDEGLSKAVLKVFVELYNEGLIYRGKRLVNWDPKFETAISDLEVENIEVDGHMWHFKYPLAGGETYEYVEKDEDGNVTVRETRDYISIATTRPETMLGDGAVAVHPGDERYAPIVGKLCEIPVGPKEHRRLIPIITDEYPDPEFGSGAVKITGAHDFNDYQVAKRSNIPLYRLMDTKGAMRDDGAPYAEEADKAKKLREAGGEPDEAYVDTVNLVPDEYRGMDRFEARKKVVADINAEGLMIMVEDKKVMQPFGDRSKVVVEPMLTDQWFIDAKTMAQPALESVKEGRTTFVPKNWEKTYFEWMENIEPWCISRQLWWGHQIPVWYGPDLPEGGFIDDPDNQGNGTIHFCAANEEEAVKLAQEHYGREVRIGVDADHFGPGTGIHNVVSYGISAALENGGGQVTSVTLNRDPDVLDTWFSSALWPFSTLGWPEKTPELERYYQTDVLVTGFDIIFFWVARMMMMGDHFMKDEGGAPIEPFHTVYIHALVRDEHGQKMSKSKGNVLDPLVLIDEFGADAVRFTLAAMAAQGRDIKLSTQRIAGYRNFATKLWNAVRFAQINGASPSADFDPSAVNEPVNQWILTEASKALADVNAALEGYRFNDAANAAYRFTWNLFCDWYLELLKPTLNAEDGAKKQEARETMAYVIDLILKLLHPFMPFITEELWSATASESGREKMLVLSDWPTLNVANDTAAADINWVIELITATRSLKAEMNIAPGARLSGVLVSEDPDVAKRMNSQAAVLDRVGRFDTLELASNPPDGSIQFVAGQATVCLNVGDVVDFAEERARLEKEVGRLQGEISRIEKKLANENFVSRAPEAVVAGEREKRTGYEAELGKVEEALKRLA
ncbi:MAG: valine--tRNA ligase [Pseudomonadota bacterium]